MTNKVGKYELVRKLATGGMAEVFLARFEWARGLEKTVVVKRILYHLVEDPTFIEMFFAEAQLAAQLSHPNIAQIIEFGESEGVYFLSMEYVDGPSLRSLEAAAHAGGGGLPFPCCARIIAFCCEALTHAHELTDSVTGKPLSLVHRDVSPDNILVSKAGSVKLVDFGIAKAATQGHKTKTGLVKGKLAYMAPEQLLAQPLDRRADIFSLGVVLYEMVAGTKPYDATSEVTLIHAMLYEDMVPLRSRRPDVPPELERIVNKALEREREYRYADCRAMHADLEAYLLSARQSVSALQIAHLVEQYRLEPGKAEGAPPPALSTPNPPSPAPRTPQPRPAERTPPGAATAQFRKPLQRTGTDGESGSAAVEREPPVAAPPDPIEEKETNPSLRERRSRESSAPALKSRIPILVAVSSAAALLAGMAALLWPSKLPAVEKSEVAVVAPSPPALPQPQLQPPVAPTMDAPPEPARSLSKAVKLPQVELVVHSEPPAMIKVSSGKVRESGLGQVTALVSPGPNKVNIEVTSTGKYTFVKRESITLDPLPRQQERTIKVEQGIVMIHSSPAAHLTVDGVHSGDSPLKLRLYEGEHTIRFECDRTNPRCAGGLEATQTVTVKPGEESNVTQSW